MDQRGVLENASTPSQASSMIAVQGAECSPASSTTASDAYSAAITCNEDDNQAGGNRLWVQEPDAFLLLAPLHPGGLQPLSEDQRAAAMVEQNATLLNIDGLQHLISSTDDLSNEYPYPARIDFDARLDEDGDADDVNEVIENSDEQACQ